MKTKVVYVLVSGQDDCYFEQFLVSSYSLRLHNPSCIIEVVADAVTYRSFEIRTSSVYDYADNVISVDVPEGLSSFQISRYLKTKLREIVSGDYLYLDTDTIVCGDISELDCLVGSLYAVNDKNRNMALTKYSGWPYEVAEKVGLARELSGEPYFNGGVLYSKDSDASHTFYSKWHECWLFCKEKGVSTDQTALCMANKECEHAIKPMDYKFNCQINADGLLFVKEALVVHYFSDKYPEYLMSRPSVQQTIKVYGAIPPFILDFINNPKIMFSSPDALIKVRMKKIFNPAYVAFRYLKAAIKR